jgi:GNAT superfamily N-acetyltransferase
MTQLRWRDREDFSERELQDLTTWLEVAFDDPPGSWPDRHWQDVGTGPHFLIQEDGMLLAHACIGFGHVRAAGRRLVAGFVENVATAPAHRMRGLGSEVMLATQEELARIAEIGVLASGHAHFYERLGWEYWPGQTSVCEPDGRTTLTDPDIDGHVFVFRTPQSPGGLDVLGTLQRDRRRSAEAAW